MDTLINNKPVLIALSVVAFLVALLLVVVIARMLFGGRLRMPGGRSRQARLGIVDAFDLDRQRQLIIVRRDNTEHLIMIGGPNDLLIESEIVRIEARERGRDKPEAGFGDRIPAPFAATPPTDPAPPRQEEPLLPMPLPETPAAAAPSDVAPARGPTFPLPQRRPAPPPPERRPPAPPRLPETATRAEPVPPPPPAAAPISDAPVTPPPAELAPLPPPAAAPRPAFLKPLPPRPPIRPLKRVTPQATNPEAVAPEITPSAPSQPTTTGASVPVASPAPTAPPLSPPPPAPAPTAPPAATAPKPAPAPEPDALDSLEEEMAKLLGRGPGA